MAAPTPTVRGTPAGRKLKDGFKSLITFANNTTIKFWEKTLKPPGIDGGEKIEQTTMHNTTYHTFAPQALKMLTDGTAKVAYDPAVFTQIVAICNQETTITVTFSDGSTWAFYGFLQKFEPDDLVRGTQPEATVTFVATNYDNANNVEAGPAVVDVIGT